ncbi:MAG: DUF4384 domain-containing protein [Thermodesulfobacteriota bacterium]
MKRTVSKLGLALALLLAVSLGLAARAAALEIRATAGDFKVVFTPLQDKFKVGERIDFQVRGNKDFFLYLFSVDAQRSKGYVLLPNKFQQNSYKANREYRVPEPNVEFFSRKPGLEKVIMIASTTKLNLDTAGYAKSGDFLSTAAADLETQVKALSLRPAQPGQQTLTQEFELVIAGPDRKPPAPAAQAGSGATAFVSTDRTKYKVGERIKITYGADKAGFVYLFQVDPQGKKSLLKKQAVNGQGFLQETGQADAPAGRHAVIAVYDETGDLDAGEMMSKGIRLFEEKPRPHAVYQLEIVD